MTTSSHISTDHSFPDIKTHSSELTEFKLVTPDETEKFIRAAASKTCELDPVPTSIVKDCLSALLPVLTKIINLSLSTSTFPTKFKEAFVSPLLKKSTLDPELLMNYRPVSNLHFMSKIIEKVVATQLNTYLDINNLHEIYQSAYKKFHITESALLRVQNDILQAIDKNSAVILLMLDLSAAFDTVDHEIMLSGLECRFGITGCALEWFRSYLANRTQTVLVNNVTSSASEIRFGVPQGSVLGPLLFSLYTSPLGNIVRKLGMQLHLYADDTQIYLIFNPKCTIQTQSVRITTEACVQDIKAWMHSNSLKLNDDKTELLVFHSRYTPRPSIESIRIGNEDIQVTNSARNIGVILDDTLSYEKQVSAICKIAFYHLHNIWRIRKYLNQETTKMIVHAFITSKLDYCNSLLYGLPNFLIQKLQSIQNTAARLVTGTSKYSHITPVLYHLHWLPVDMRIKFKILLFTFKALKNQAPSYIKELLEEYKPTRNLRSGSKDLLKCKRSRLKTYGDRSFTVAAPSLWNSLPAHIKASESVDIFKQNLKTYLYKKSYDIL